MVQVYPDISCLQALQLMIANGVRIWAYTNDVTPDEDSVKADFAEAANCQVSLDEADFVIQEISGHLASVVAAPTLLDNAGASAIDVYGVLMEDASTGDMLAVARLDDAPVNVPVGESIPWLPMLSALWSH